MLPVLIYETDTALRAMLLQTLKALPGAAMLKIISASASADDTERFFAAQEGITLTVIGLSMKSGNRRRGLDLGRAIMRKNRDNYTVYCIHELTDMESVLSACERPAGILLAPFSEERVAACLQRIVEEYASLNEDEGDATCLTLSSGASTYRIPFEQITYIEALDKKLSIYTHRQTITVRGALGNLIDQLPEQFVRCHRSYVVNIRAIRQTDYAEMTLTLADGDTLPISRSSRAELRQKLEGAQEVNA